MSFHECGGDVGDDVLIPLSHWVTEIGQKNPDIYILLIKKGNRVLRGRTAVEEGMISEIEVGLGPCGELQYPSYPEQHGWKYPGIAETAALRASFQQEVAVWHKLDHPNIPELLFELLYYTFN
ncbi:unnamed protein product [Malus baccata var. baccata]